eukprot:scaffold57955_cov69-Phaeocystis_antarctica.AAC.4
MPLCAALLVSPSGEPRPNACRRRNSPRISLADAACRPPHLKDRVARVEAQAAREVPCVGGQKSCGEGVAQPFHHRVAHQGKPPRPQARRHSIAIHSMVRHRAASRSELPLRLGQRQRTGVWCDEGCARELRKVAGATGALRSGRWFSTHDVLERRAGHQGAEVRTTAHPLVIFSVPIGSTSMSWTRPQRHLERRELLSHIKQVRSPDHRREGYLHGQIEISSQSRRPDRSAIQQPHRVGGVHRRRRATVLAKSSVEQA